MYKMYNQKKIGVIGAGSFGTALAMVLTGKGHQVTLGHVKKSTSRI